jgi:Calcium-activated BK potassium channel alpha subunit
MERDLDRASVQKASSCVVMTLKQNLNADIIDHRNILTGIAIKKYAHANRVKNFKFCIQLIKPESKKHFYSSIKSSINDQIIVLEEIKMNLMAKSCFCPGIISLIGNLVRSSGDQESQRLKKKWIKEYSNGMGHEIYRTRLSTKY